MFSWPFSFAEFQQGLRIDQVSVHTCQSVLFEKLVRRERIVRHVHDDTGDLQSFFNLSYKALQSLLAFWAYGGGDGSGL